METIVVICVGIMCWLFCTFYFFGFVYEEDDTFFDKILKYIIAMFIGWIATPIIVGLKHGNSIFKI